MFDRDQVECFIIGDESPLIALVKEKEDLERNMRRQINLNIRKQRQFILKQMGETQ